MLDDLAEIDDSAIGVAALRVMENERSAPLVIDSFAARVLATGVPSRQLTTTLAGADRQTREISSSIAVCGHAFDEFAQAGLDEGVAQLVILGAGLDNRAWRLPIPEHACAFELDRPEVIDFKRRVMTSIGAPPTARHLLVGVDLRRDWPEALRDAGFDPRAPSIWIAEGVLPQLPADAMVALLDRVDRLSWAGSRFALNHIGSDPGSVRAGMQSLIDGFEVRNSDWSDETHADAGGWLTQHGWSVQESSVSERARQVGREIASDIGLIDRTRIVLARTPSTSPV